MYICPICRERLIKSERQLKCTNNHSFDISSKGYVNLILNSRPTRNHGDSKEMLACRRDFLSLGHYSPIITELARVIENTGLKSITLLDAGCGEGYYTSALKNILKSKEINTDFYGIDVSKDAVMLAARDKELSLSVASINALPFADSSFDIVISLFAPLNESEFSRVLKQGGILITVSPSENHLFGLKKQIYETPYKNPPSTFIPELFSKADTCTLEYKIHLDNARDITNLFKMTPYYHKTSKTDIEKALAINELETEVGFEISTFKKLK